MTAGSATSLAMLLYAVGAVPIAWLAFRPASVRWLGPICGALIVGMAFYQTGLFRDASLASTEVTHLIRVDTPESRCQQVFDLLVENGVMLEQPRPQGLVVRSAAWDQLPPAVREAVLACAQSALGSEGDVPVTRR